LHDNSLSTDGYNYPDYSGQAFVGWQNECPYLIDYVDGVNEAGYHFMYSFYLATLFYGYNINSALNFASNEVWCATFDQTCFYSGFESEYGPMVVYGQGTLYIGNNQWVSDIVWTAAGFYQEAFVASPENLIGQENDGYSAHLYADTYGDYAWITGHMDTEANGEIHIWGNAAPGTVCHVLVYVSNDYYNWNCVWSDYVDNRGSNNYDPRDISCGYSEGFNYIAVTIYNDLNGMYYDPYICDFYADAVHVYT
jgi:hypothetical protein